ncbi:HD domain-containing phosphohydrolase [Thermodesulfobacteriota bacterium]
MKIIIAEDDAITLRRLQHFLQKWGHEVTGAQNGRIALEHFLSSEVEMVITDWMMPEMDGLELVRRIIAAEKPYVYVILLTSRGEKGDVVRALSEDGVDDYIIKPFDPDELRARIGVGERTVNLERTLQEYSHGLEKIVEKQTRVIRETQEETIYRLLAALESRDDETGGHVRRIALFSVLLAEAHGWEGGDLEDLRLAAPMHDIGKIGVPDAILRKPASLTPEEYEIIKTHTTIGGQILSNSQFAMLRLAHDIAISHHEKWDGSGYPKGIARDDIPLVGRIVALVDVYDALSNDRVYHKALPENEVLELMNKGRGSHFDPHIFDLFLKRLPEFKVVSQENP